MLMRKVKSKITHTQAIAVGFLAVICIGTLLLMLPVATVKGEITTPLSALFTATSATCVTGLVVVDTSSHWTLFGQAVILLMIQIGGLGFLTMGVFFSIILKRKITLKTRGILQDSMNVMKVGGIVRLAKKVVYGTILIEGIGTVLLAIRFIPRYGWGKGIYFGIFHSISAFCNAGFDLMGFQEPYMSLTAYSNDWLVNLTIMSLIVIGGIGFIVWDDLLMHRFHMKNYSLHTKLVLSTTAILLVGGAILFYVFEKDGLMKEMSASETFLTAVFSSVTARTAGFNTIDTAALSDSSKLLTDFLMFIGGSPGSTAGGVKTVTLAVLLVYVWSNLRSSKSSNVFKRRLSDESIKKASSVLIISLGMAVMASIAIAHLQKLETADILFEVFSAIGTVGMSTGITRELVPASRFIIILLMFCGRLGSMSFAMSFTERKKVAPIQLPLESVMIG